MNEGMLAAIIMLVVIFSVIWIGIYISKIDFPDPDKRTLFIYDKQMSSNGFLSSASYYVAGFDENNTKVVLELKFSGDIMKTELNKTNIYECPHGTDFYCTYIDTLKY
jgi:hypothetical protein